MLGQPKFSDSNDDTETSIETTENIVHDTESSIETTEDNIYTEPYIEATGKPTESTELDRQLDVPKSA